MNERKNTEWSRDNNCTSKVIGLISVSDLIINITIHSGVSFRLRSLFKLLKNWFYHSIIILIMMPFTIHSQINSNYLQTRFHHQSSHSLIISYSIHFIPFIHSIQSWSYDFYPQIVILNDSSLIIILRFYVIHFYIILSIQSISIQNSYSFRSHKQWIQTLKSSFLHSLSTHLSFIHFHSYCLH